MNENKKFENQNYIYFFQFTPKLSNYYIALATEFLKYKINLVAIKVEDYTKIADQGRRFVLAFCPDLASQETYLKFKRSVFDFSITSGRSVFFHLSAFRASPPETGFSQNVQKSYKHISLPIEVEEACKEMALVYYKEKETNELWPGGRRPRGILGEID